MEKKELKTLDWSTDEHGIAPESLRLLLELDMENYDFRFQSGAVNDVSKSRQSNAILSCHCYSFR